MRKLKLIWDFRGPDAANIAKHHDIHLKAYIQKEQLNDVFSGAHTVNELHSFAFVVVDEDKMKPLRDALKPHRGQIYQK